MTQESRTFTGLGTFSLTYTYNNAGLASVTGPSQFGSSQVSYDIDHTGTTTAVKGASTWSASVYEQNMQYRASGDLKAASYGNGRSLGVTYDKRLRLDSWLVAGVAGWKYSYGDFGENTGRVTYAQNLYDSVANAADPTLDRSYDYDSVGRLLNSYTGTEAKAHTGRPGGAWGVHDGPYSQAYLKDSWGNVTQKMGRAGDPDQFTAAYTNNRRNGFSYDAAGNLTFDGGQTFTYDATGQQATASYGGYSLANSYDGDRLRVKKVENGSVTYYLRSSVLGGSVVAEIGSTGAWQRGYVYGAGGELLALQNNGLLRWVHQDPATKSQRMVDFLGVVSAGVDLDPWGLETARSWNSSQQPRKYTTYERDGNGSDEAAQRRYNRWHLRFDQPDPYGGSYDLTSPQSFNRYTYTDNDPVNLTDPSGLMAKAGDSCTAGDGQPGIVDGDGKCSPGLREVVTVTGSRGGLNDGLASLMYGRMALDLLLQSTVPLPSDLRARVAKRVDNPKTDCSAYISKLIAEAAKIDGKAYSTDAMKNYDRVAGEGGFKLKEQKDKGTANFDGNKRVVHIKPVSDPSDSRKADNIQTNYAGTALNEVIHHAKNGGVYGDRTMAKATFNMMTPEQQKENPLPSGGDDEGNTRYWHPKLLDHCQP
jgi:RHS repeat-associated protein